MKYTVGQVLYFVLRKETRVYPMQVIEEITKKTLDGEVTSYMVRGGTDPKAQMLISEVDGEVFDSADKAKAQLIERATASITRIVDVAVTKAREWYPGSFEAPSDDPLTLLKKQPTPGAPPPTKVPVNPGNASKKRPLAELTAELQHESDRIAEEGEATLVPIGPDGQQAKIRSVKLPDGMS